MAHTAPVGLDDLATLAGACNIAHAPDANDIAALHAQLTSSLYHLSAAHCPGVVPQNAFPPSNTPTSSVHRYPPWTTPVLEPHATRWPSIPSASASASISSSSSGTSPEDNEEEEMMLDSPIPSGPNSLFPPPTGRHNGGSSGGSGGRPCTPVLPVTMTATMAMTNTSLVHPNSASHPHFHDHHSRHHPFNGTSDTAYESTPDSFATSDPFYIGLQQQQQQQRSRTLQAIPLSFQAQGQAAGYSVQHAPLLRQNHAPVHTHRGAPNSNSPSSSSFSSSSPSNPFALRPRY